MNLISSPTPAWWPGVRARARQAAAAPRIALHIEGRPVGSIAMPLLADMQAAGLPLAVQNATVSPAGAPDAALADIAHWLRATGRAGRWRDEALAVCADDGTPLARVERGAARNLGIYTTAVHLHAATADGRRHWLQLRALSKATDPGLWDTTMGGLVAAGESLQTALRREAWEEAGLRLDDAAPVYCGAYTLRRPVLDAGSHGYMVETAHAWTCTLPADAVPANQDGEVQRLEAFDDAAIDTLIETRRLTLEGAVAIALCRSGAAALEAAP